MRADLRLRARVEQSDGPAAAVREWVTAVLAVVYDPRLAKRARLFAGERGSLARRFPDEIDRLNRHQLELLEPRSRRAEPAVSSPWPIRRTTRGRFVTFATGSSTIACTARRRCRVETRSSSRPVSRSGALRAAGMTPPYAPTQSLCLCWHRARRDARAMASGASLPTRTRSGSPCRRSTTRADAGLDPKDIDGFSSYSDDAAQPSALSMALGTPRTRYSGMVWGGGGAGWVARSRTRRWRSRPVWPKSSCVVRAICQSPQQRFGQSLAGMTRPAARARSATRSRSG